MLPKGSPKCMVCGVGVAEPLAVIGKRRSLDSLMGVCGSSDSFISGNGALVSSSVIVSKDSQGDGEQTIGKK